jgi:hypothetical protein
MRRTIREQARNRCEYCLIHSDDVYMPHEIDHIIAQKHGGETSLDNLCLSCADCNRHKGSDLATLDPQTREPVLLFHPRRDHWEDHFQLDGIRIGGLTPTGRATARLLQMNTTDRLLERAALIDLDRYP